MMSAAVLDALLAGAGAPGEPTQPPPSRRRPPRARDGTHRPGSGGRCSRAGTGRLPWRGRSSRCSRSRDRAPGSPGPSDRPGKLEGGRGEDRQGWGSQAQEGSFSLLVHGQIRASRPCPRARQSTGSCLATRGDQRGQPRLVCSMDSV